MLCHKRTLSHFYNNFSITFVVNVHFWRVRKCRWAKRLQNSPVIPLSPFYTFIQIIFICLELNSVLESNHGTHYVMLFSISNIEWIAFTCTYMPFYNVINKLLCSITWVCHNVSSPLFIGHLTFFFLEATLEFIRGKKNKKLCNASFPYELSA